MDITLQIKRVKVVNPENTDQHFTTRAGAIVQAFLTSRMADWDGTEFKSREPIATNRPLAYVHMKDCPDSWNLETIGQKLSWVPTEFDPITGQDLPLRKRGFYVDLEGIPLARKNELINNRETTVTWGPAVRDRIRKVSVNIGDKFNQDADTDQAVVDGDIA